jgi:hypothetical protein
MHSIQDHACSQHVVTSSRESGHLAGRPIVKRISATRSDPVLCNSGHLAVRQDNGGQMIDSILYYTYSHKRCLSQFLKIEPHMVRRYRKTNICNKTTAQTRQSLASCQGCPNLLMGCLSEDRTQKSLQRRKCGERPRPGG